MAKIDNLSPDGKQPLEKIEDFTQLGGYKKKSNTRPADNVAHKEAKDSKHDKFSEFSHNDDDERHRQPMFKGDGYEGSATSDEWLDKDFIKSRLKVESFDVDIDSMKKLLENTLQDEEFVTQAMDVFKATLQDAVDKIEESVTEKAVDYITESVLEIQEAYDERLDAEVEHLNESISDYVDVAVMEWIADNKLAIQESTQAAIANAFMDDLGALLEAYSIKVPEDKVDLYESAVDAGNKLYSEYEELLEDYNQLLDEVQSMKRTAVTESWIDDAGLTMAQAERVRTLAENLEFTDVESFTDKLGMIAEAFVENKQRYVPDSLLEDTYDELDQLDEDEQYDDEVSGILRSSLFTR